MERAATIGFDLNYRSYPTVFWDMFGKKGHPVRTTVSEMGPLLLSRLLGLTDAQEGVLNIAFHLADKEGLALLDLDDLRAMLRHVGEQSKDIALEYGNVDTRSIGAIQRQLLVLENQGGDQFFGEPALELGDLIRTDSNGMGQINLLAADQLMASPQLYATFLLWLLSELFEELPEVGNPDKPKLVFFFDEAHLLFDDAPKAMVDKVEQVARLIRSKGVGVYFITQNPTDVPDGILSQLGNRVQHALRAFTARDQRDLKRAAENYRANPRFDTELAIKEVGTGEAVTSFLQAKGVPGVVERTLVRPPQSRLGPLHDDERAAVMAQSGLGAKYDTPVDRNSAQEILAERARAAAREAAEAEAAATSGTASGAGAALDDSFAQFNNARRYTPASKSPARKSPTRSSRSDSVITTFGKSLARQLGTKTGQALVRGVLGSLFKSR